MAWDKNLHANALSLLASNLRRFGWNFQEFKERLTIENFKLSVYFSWDERKRRKNFFKFLVSSIHIANY